MVQRRAGVRDRHVGGRATITREFGARRRAVLARAPDDDAGVHLRQRVGGLHGLRGGARRSDVPRRPDRARPRSRTGDRARPAVGDPSTRPQHDQQPPRRANGYVASAAPRTGRPWLGGDYDYYEITARGATTSRSADRAVVAVRARAARSTGSATAGDDVNVPFFKRYFLGGATNLRGWGRFEVAPLSDGALPIGGHRSPTSRPSCACRSGGISAACCSSTAATSGPTLGLQPERPAVRRRPGAPLQHADRSDPRRLRLPAESDSRAAGQRQAGAGAFRFHFSIGQAF